MQERFEHKGHTFVVRIECDDAMGAPWKEHDGHGPVSDWTTRAKMPGERVLASDRRQRCYYDFAEAVKIAKRDGWDAPPYSTGTRGQRAARAAEADFRRLQAWCNGDWSWIGVVVQRVCDCCGGPTGETQSLWGIESYAGDYLDEVARELADELLPETAAA